MKKRYLLLGTLFYAIAVLYLAVTTPISPHEAKLLYDSHSFAALLMQWSSQVFPGFLGLRLVFLFFGFASIWFFYLLSRYHFEKINDAYLATCIFMLLPGIMTASVMANIGIIVLPLVLLFVLLYEKGQRVWLPFIMLALFFIHEASVIFFISLLLYAIASKDKTLAIVSSAFLLASVYLAKGISMGGRPSGHFIEIFGLYASLFSPLVFLYFFYTMYRIFLRGKKSLIWYISFTAFAFSLLLSLRQRIYLTDFAPYVLVAIVLMVDQFHLSLRVRLQEFRRWYDGGFYVVMGFLLLSALIILFHQTLYFVSSHPEKHFARRIYDPFVLARSLQAKGVHCYDTENKRKRLQLKYYGIQSCKMKK